MTGAGTSARPITPAPRSPFGPPLALESGPSTAPAAPGREPASAGSGPSAFAAPTSGSGYGSGIAGAFGGGGLGAALGGAGLGVPTPTSGGPAGLFNGGGGGGGIGSPAVRGNQPAWSDLIGHPNSPNGTELRPPRPPVPLSGPGPGEPLPQRRSTDSWATPPGADEQAIPRQRPHAPDEVPAVPDEAPAVPTEPVGEAPPLPEAAASAPLAPPAAAPPAPPPWPPVPEPLPEPRPMPEGLTSALDMTAEIPRVREDWSGPGSAASTSGGVNGEASRRFADETMELPIFRELESAWFRTRGSEPEPYPAVEPSGDVGVPYDRATGAPAEEAAVREPEAEPVEASAEPVAAGGNGWHTAADEGWRAASALASDQEFATTSTGLPKRVPMTQLVPGGVEKGTMAAQRRSPEAVRGLLSAYHRGVQRGRSTRSGDPKTPEHTTAGQQNSQGGKEQDS